MVSSVRVNPFIIFLARDYLLPKVEGNSAPAPEQTFNIIRQLVGLYGSANDPRTANDPEPQMIPKLDRR